MKPRMNTNKHGWIGRGAVHCPPFVNKQTAARTE